MQSLELFPLKKLPQHFSNSRINSGKHRLNELLDRYKDKLHINYMSVQTPLEQPQVSCSLSQAKYIQKLSKTLPRRSFHRLVSTYQSGRGLDLNQFASESYMPDPQKLKLFRQGVNYRSRERARGTGVTPIDKQSLQDYLNFRESEKQEAETPIKLPTQTILGHTRFSKTSFGGRSISLRSRPATRM